jgi:hypothetical protein
MLPCRLHLLTKLGQEIGETDFILIVPCKRNHANAHTIKSVQFIQISSAHGALFHREHGGHFPSSLIFRNVRKTEHRRNHIPVLLHFFLVTAKKRTHPLPGISIPAKLYKQCKILNQILTSLHPKQIHMAFIAAQRNCLPLFLFTQNLIYGIAMHVCHFHIFSS